MSAVEGSKLETAAKSAPSARAAASPLTRVLNLFSSVRFGVSLLVLLVIGSMIGMLIMQQNVEGFDKYYAELTPSQQLLYGTLGFFDIYHAWYFNVLLLVLSLNIILASIDRFPNAWTFISRPKLDASAQWLRGQKQNATLQLEGESRQTVAARISEACRSLGFKARVTEKNNRTFVFAERGAWNRLGAYAVHVALLTIFTGGFLTAQFGHTGEMQLTPGKSSSQISEINFSLDQMTRTPYELPFTITCTDIEQQLIRKEGAITADNTIDWLTRIKIKDEYGTREALVHLNHPYDYRGYRLFQASFISLGNARNITLRLTPEDGGEVQNVTIKRDGQATLPDGTRIQFANFFPDFTLAGGQPSTASGEYNNPAAFLRITTPAGEQKNAYAFAVDLPGGAPIGAPVAGYKFRLADFEKVPTAHILSIQRDPGTRIVYIGFVLLGLTLSAVFFFSHQRVWAQVEERGAQEFEVTLGGNTNRNWLGFEDRFKKLAHAVSGNPPQQEEVTES
ncbi:MAG: cytochrome c biogenesis protein ResB [Pyrinomonadaceae bacterium]